MTQSLTALFSPETSPHPADLQPFRLLCDSLFFYALPGESEEREMAGGYTPVRLSTEDQIRFQSLAKELKGHEAEFHGGLLASLSAGHGDRDEASVGSLISSLRFGAKAVQPQKTGDEMLWQAMLILKLAEMFREEEREIAQGFMAVSGKEAELFAAIRGEEIGKEAADEEEKQALRELAVARALSGCGPTLNLTQLARAWGRLYTQDKRAAEIPLLVTSHAELQALLAEAYETLTGRLPKQLVSLALPTQAESAEHRLNTGAAREHFNLALLGIAANGTIAAERLASLQGAGNDLNREFLPLLASGMPEKTMRFYAYEGVSLIDLFAKLCGAPLAEPRQAPAAATGLLAVLG